MIPEYECPYCEHGMNNVDDIYEPDTSYEMECEECEKLFHVTVEYSPDYATHTDEVEIANVSKEKAYQKKLRNLRL